MDLNRETIPSVERLKGNAAFDLNAGDSIKIETTHGNDILDEEVPAGKLWHVKIEVSITEVTA